MHQKPSCFSASSIRERLLARTSATRSKAPEAALARVPVAWGAWRSCTTTAAAPKAAAERSTAPTLRGSEAWSSTTTKALSRVATMRPRSSGESGARGSASRAAPWWTAPAGRTPSRVRRSTRSGRRPAAVAACPRAGVPSSARPVSNSLMQRRSGLARAAATAWTPNSQMPLLPVPPVRGTPAGLRDLRFAMVTQHPRNRRRRKRLRLTIPRFHQTSPIAAFGRNQKNRITDPRNLCGLRRFLGSVIQWRYGLEGLEDGLKSPDAVFEQRDKAPERLARAVLRGFSGFFN